jgi:hypothetical protein
MRSFGNLLFAMGPLSKELFICPCEERAQSWDGACNWQRSRSLHCRRRGKDCARGEAQFFIFLFQLLQLCSQAFQIFLGS